MIPIAVEELTSLFPDGKGQM